MFGRSAVALMVICCMGVAAGDALAGGAIPNGDFSQKFKKWTRTTDGGDLFRLKKTDGSLSGPSTCSVVEDLPAARSVWSPFSDHCGNPGRITLYRTLKVPSKANRLKMWIYHYNVGAPYEFDGSWASKDDQYYSVDILKKNAGFDTSNPNKVIRNVFAPEIPLRPRAKRGDPAPPDEMPWTKFVTSIPKKYRGGKIKVRLITSVNEAPILAGIDDLKFLLKK